MESLDFNLNNSCSMKEKEENLWTCGTYSPVEPPRVSRIGALLQGLGCAPGTSRFLPSFGSEQESSSASGRRGRRAQSTRSRMPVMRGLLAPQNTFLDTIATRFDGTRE
ncbi:potassium voltage-gated channel subfamily H member 3-like protein [Lates japonicus]|uniref:Potassium voltage-gated channel subfamily H member 3-like protein n=1 Tax=Lates japonicus TaxID=270547 RepID=A0AAD3MM61_LATJO|nr:potassium voltage-gated channel subfamily H member 3-like protein [Lates japonicus]